MTGNIEVIVIGGGYAGVMAANRLTQRDDVTVTSDQPAPELRRADPPAPAGERVPRRGRSTTAKSSTRASVWWSTPRPGSTPAARSVTLASGATVGYDYLVYAGGSGSADPGVPGAAEFAHPIATWSGRTAAAGHRASPATAPVTVVGAGPTGIETAAELAEQGRT